MLSALYGFTCERLPTVRAEPIFRQKLTEASQCVSQLNKLKTIPKLNSLNSLGRALKGSESLMRGADNEEYAQPGSKNWLRE